MFIHDNKGGWLYQYIITLYIQTKRGCWIFMELFVLHYPLPFGLGHPLISLVVRRYYKLSRNKHEMTNFCAFFSLSYNIRLPIYENERGHPTREGWHSIIKTVDVLHTFLEDDKVSFSTECSIILISSSRRPSSGWLNRFIYAIISYFLL